VSIRCHSPANKCIRFAINQVCHCEVESDRGAAKRIRGAAESALALNPNFIDNRFAFALSCAGKHERAIEVLEANIRLDPFQPVIFSLGAMGMANYMLKRYDALRLLRECASRLPNLQACHVFLASAYAQSGRLDEARAEAAEILRINPNFTIERWKPLAVYKNPKDAEHRIDGLRRAGLPED
jgi:adenylate cyclase